MLLLGGPSGVGKSVVTAELARRCGVTTGEIDDIHSAVVRMTTPQQYPDLHRWNTDPAAPNAGPDQIVAWHLAACRALEPAVEAVIETHLDNGPRVIVEGDYLLPSCPGLHRPGVAAAFLVETDTQQIARNYAAREPEAGIQTGRAGISARLSAELLRQGASCGVPVVASRPWDDVADRVLAAVRGR